MVKIKSIWHLTNIGYLENITNNFESGFKMNISKKITIDRKFLILLKQSSWTKEVSDKANFEKHVFLY